MKTIRLTIISALEILTFVGALVYFLNRIASTLERIGGSPTSYLAKLSFGLSAIEKETSHLAPQVTQLNQGLIALAGELGTSDEHLKTVAEALSEGKEGSL